MVIVNIGGLPSYSLLMRNTLATFSYEQHSATYDVFGDGHALPEIIFTHYAPQQDNLLLTIQLYLPARLFPPIDTP